MRGERNGNHNHPIGHILDGISLRRVTPDSRWRQDQDIGLQGEEHAFKNAGPHRRFRVVTQGGSWRHRSGQEARFQPGGHDRPGTLSPYADGGSYADRIACPLRCARNGGSRIAPATAGRSGQGSGHCRHHAGGQWKQPVRSHHPNRRATGLRQHCHVVPWPARHQRPAAGK